MTVEVVTLGCRLNLSESEDLRALLGQERDLVVINSCAVTGEAVRQTRRAIRRMRQARPDARLLVTGCAAEVEREALAAMPEVDGLVANAAKLDPRAYSPSPSGEGLGWGLSLPNAEISRQPPPPAPPLKGRGDAHTRAFVQVQNGCDHACTFCVIPQGRGPSRSRSIAEVVAEIAGHLDRGVHEVVLTGVDVTGWGHDLPQASRLGSLVAAVLAACPSLERLRLSSLDGVEIDPELLDLLGSEARVMPHLHLSLQSGDDLILKRMKRRHSRADAIGLVAKLKARRPEIAIGADLIAGFPTEDEAMHAANRAIIAELGIVHGHVFPYSQRPGTPAARMPQVEPATIKRRAAELRAAVDEERRAWLASLIGTPLSVLAERDGSGHAQNFARVLLPAGTTPGTMIQITPTRIAEGLLA
ncbi:MAG: tRNA (N(6)-L-threonylcarbamoyladenosine(37)-C(2))-methylthiotransferase MtaB [Novosphingobium sp.]